MLGRHIAAGDPETAIDANKIIEMSKQQTAAEPGDPPSLQALRKTATLKGGPLQALGSITEEEKSKSNSKVYETSGDDLGHDLSEDSSRVSVMSKVQVETATAPRLTKLKTIVSKNMIKTSADLS
jgi:hypothetical protein